MPISNTVIPLLFPSWAKTDHVMNRPLVPPDVARNAPIVAYMTEKDSQVVPITPDQVLEPEELDDAMVRYLHRRPASWKIEELDLDTGRKLTVMACEEDPFACARIMDPDFMNQAHDKLQAPALVVSIPVQGMMFATRAPLMESDLQAFSDLIYKVYSDPEFHPVSPILFLVENCHVRGALAGINEAARPVQRTLPVQVHRRMMSNGDYSIEINIRKTPPIAPRFLEILRVVEKVVQTDGEGLTFNGIINLVINAGSGQRSPDAEVKKEIASLQRKVDRLTAQREWTTVQNAPVKIFVKLLQPETEGSAYERRSTGSLASALLQSMDVKERANCAEELGRRGDPSAVRPLVAALEDEDAHVRQASVDALVMLGELAVSYLEYFAESASSIGRAHALEALHRIYPGQFTELMLRAVAYPDEQVRYQAAVALSETKDPELKSAIFEMLNDPFSPIRVMAIHWLSDFEEDWALDGLINALGDLDETVRGEARSAVVARGKSVTETLKARRKVIDRSRHAILYEAVSDVLEEVDGGGGGFLGLFKRGR